MYKCMIGKVEILGHTQSLGNPQMQVVSVLLCISLHHQDSAKEAFQIGSVNRGLQTPFLASLFPVGNLTVIF